ncbi:hypothetical protein NEIMUCOT_05391 [Neisseria mucosa ATCC 25996]|uniref:Uncharacterized protein n=1 Tax=Neisseria mucosa (strain ATCC 25996 / DSM 4631 / NCTC 10774 / M26) TaxID=546266 RepID=D2ZXN7_NEIM2|nr:hypothetical protein NEIMUCOT_05391 [Neisseria mucosa ATCC 25996]
MLIFGCRILKNIIFLVRMNPGKRVLVYKLLSNKKIKFRFNCKVRLRK